MYLLIREMERAAAEPKIRDSLDLTILSDISFKSFQQSVGKFPLLTNATPQLKGWRGERKCPVSERQ